MQRAYVNYQDQGVLFLGIFYQSREDDIRKFAEKYELTFPVGKDSGIAAALRARGIPEAFFLNREGKTVAHHIGQITYDQLQAGIEEMIP